MTTSEDWSLIRHVVRTLHLRNLLILTEIVRKGLSKPILDPHHRPNLLELHCLPRCVVILQNLVFYIESGESKEAFYKSQGIVVQQLYETFANMGDYGLEIRSKLFAGEHLLEEDYGICLEEEPLSFQEDNDFLKIKVNRSIELNLLDVKSRPFEKNQILFNDIVGG